MDDKVARIEEILNSHTVQRLQRFHPVDVFPTRDGMMIRVQLRDHNGKLVDVIDIPADSNGLVQAEDALHFTVLAFETAQDS